MYLPLLQMDKIKRVINGRLVNEEINSSKFALIRLHETSFKSHFFTNILVYQSVLD